MPKSEKTKQTEILSGERKFVATMDFLKSFVKWGVIAFLGYEFFALFVAGLSANPDSINALAKFCESFKAYDIFATIAGLLGGGWGAFEKRRNKKLVLENGELRHKLEQYDAVNTRSGLDKYGHSKED